MAGSWIEITESILIERETEAVEFLNDKSLQEKGLALGSLIELFHSLDLPVVAEGIETKEQYQRLKAKDCDYIQGYLFSKPLPPEEVKEIYNYNFVDPITSD